MSNQLRLTNLSQYPPLIESLQRLEPGDRLGCLRRLCRTDLYFLLTVVLGRKDIEKEWLFQRCREVQKDPNERLDLWAREHYKSTIITFGKSIQDILRSHGHDPIEPRECTIGIFSHTRSIAQGFLGQIKSELENNQLLKELFDDIFYMDPQKESPSWSEQGGLEVKRKSNPKEMTVEAHGVVDGQPVSVHFTHLVFDDVVVPGSVTSPDMMKKTTEMLSMAYNLGTSDGCKRFIGTRYHFNDSYKAIIDTGTAKPRLHPATKDGTMSGEPVFLSQDKLDKKRREQGPYIFASQMLLDPKADETQGFQRDWTKDKHSGVSWKGMNTYILFDGASEKKKGSDYTAMWAVGLHADQRVYILDILRDRLNLVQRTSRLMDWHRKYTPIDTRYEKYGKDSDIEHIKAEQKRQNYRFEITEVGGSTPKNDRIKRLIPYFEQNRIILPRTLHYTMYDGKTVDLVHDFVEQEYMGFPVGTHDDMLDALARLFEPELNLLWPKPKKKGSKRMDSGYNSPYDF